MKAKSTKRRPAPDKPIKTRKCVFCSKKGQNIDYKDTALLRTYISERGKIRARRVTGTACNTSATSRSPSRTHVRSPLLPFTSATR